MIVDRFSTFDFRGAELTDAEYDELWAAEAEARYAAFLRGEVEAEDGDEVLARAYARTL